MLSSKSKGSANNIARKHALMHPDFNLNHKYIQQCPECDGIHETQMQNDEYCIQCKELRPSAGSSAA